MHRYFDKLTIECPVWGKRYSVDLMTFHEGEAVVFTDKFRGCDFSNGLPGCALCIDYVNERLQDDPTSAVRNPLCPPRCHCD